MPSFEALSPRREVRRWLLALALMAPAAIPYVAHIADWKPYSLPTGYIQADMPLYAAKAREAFDDGRVHLAYGNPCGESYDAPRIYFQPWTFALGLAHRLTKIPLGVLWVGFWFLSAWAATRAAVAIYEEFAGLGTRAQALGLVAFVWGGGILAIAGGGSAVVTGRAPSWDDLVRFDPARGWWFLNLGRNFVYPTEALYHSLAFAALLGYARGRIGTTLAFAGVAAACSPFAGLEVLAILWAAGLADVAIGDPGRRSARMFLGINGIIAAFLSYYLGFLGRFAEHRTIAAQMALPWRYSAATFAFAYGPVLGLAAWRMRSRARLAGVAGSRRGRLLLAWAAAAITLENHDWLVMPRQPIHFTRGYAWSALFLLGAPSLVEAFARLGRGWRIALLAALVLDNALWFAMLVRDVGTPDRNGVRLTVESREVLRRLDADDLLGSVVVSEDERLSTLLLAETRLRSWVGHPLETPGYGRRRDEVEALFAQGEVSPRWRGLRLLLIRERPFGSPAISDRPGPNIPGRVIFANRRFQIFSISPGQQDTTRFGGERSAR